MGWRHLAILTALLVRLGAPAALAYPVPVDFDGKVVRWDVSGPDEPLYYEVINDSSFSVQSAESIVDASAALWSGVDGSALRLASAKDSAQARTSITVNFKSNFDGGDFAAAYAEMDETDTDGKPVHCSVNVAIRGNEVLKDLEKTVLHELGHCIGLGHSLFPKAIMSYRLSQNSFALDVDDVAAVRRLYSADGSTFEIPPGCAIGARRGNSRQRSGFTGFMEAPDLTLILLPLLCPILCPILVRILFPSLLRTLIAMLTARRLRG